MSAEDYSHLACPNADCPAYGQRGAGNLRLHGWSGSGHRIRCLHCATCGGDFSERANTPCSASSPPRPPWSPSRGTWPRAWVAAPRLGSVASASTPSCGSPTASAAHEQERQYDCEGMGQYFFPVEITYGTVHKEKKKGRVVAVEPWVVLGTAEQAEQVLAESGNSETINTSFVERYHGTQRKFNARKKRKAYTFSKELGCHEACTWLVVVWYNFGWCVRTLRKKVQETPPRYQGRTPAMAAGLADQAWSMEELLGYPLYPCHDSPPKPVRTYADVLQRLSRGHADLASG
jgi:hypothetical protein